MGFLSNIFKRKKGGTFVGNLLRGASSAMTGGILGNGSGLAKWEAKKEQEELEKLYGKATFPAVTGGGVAYDGRQVGQNLVNGVAVPAMASGSGGTNTNAGEAVVMETLKKRWYIPTAILAALGGVAYWLGNKGKTRKRKY